MCKCEDCKKRRRSLSHTSWKMWNKVEKLREEVAAMKNKIEKYEKEIREILYERDGLNQEIEILKDNYFCVNRKDSDWWDQGEINC